ncbi:MAG: tetratricopeptide repeat-containing sulfotransferase family protein [Steroidobacteraceae bacterium]
MAGTGDDDASLLRAAQRYRRAGLLTEAIGAYQKLLARHPDSPNSWYNLARLQRQARQYEAALASYQRALAEGIAAPEEAHLNRGVILSDDLHRYAEAERELQIALHLNPAYVPALMNLANLQEDFGRRTDAQRTYEHILVLEPSNLPALARYAQTQIAAQTSDALLQTLRTRLSDPRGETGGRASVGFALGRALDGRGEYAAAFDTYTEANRLSRVSAGTRFASYDRAAHELLIDRIIAAFSAAAHSVQGALPGPPAPVFICGMFRSGSTLIEQLLARHPQIRAAGELDWLPRIAQEALFPFPSGAASAPPQRLAALGKQYLRHLATVFPDAAQVTDKRPDNFLYIGLIKRLFPTAKIVHTTRDPLDNCLSVFFLHLDHSMSYALDLLDIGHYYRQYIRLMAYWKQRFPGDIFDVHYDTLVREPQKPMQRLLEFLGLTWDEHCLEPAPSGRAVRTASVWQVRQRLYQSSSGRSRHYLEQLGKLRAYLNETAPQGAPER